MTKEMAKFLQECSENAGNECDIREDYSGRGMYGETTIGVVVDSATQLLADVIQYVSEQIGEYTYSNANDEEVTIDSWEGPKIPDPTSFRIDNLGSRTILY